MLARHNSQTRMSPLATVTALPVSDAADTAVSDVPGSVAFAGWSRNVPTTAPVDGRHAYTQTVGLKLDPVLDSDAPRCSCHVPAAITCAASGGDSNMRSSIACAVVDAAVVPAALTCPAPGVPSICR